MSGPWPKVEELVPQRGPMCLLDRVLSHDADATRCAARPSDAVLFRDEDGRVPSWVGLEHMAQCATVHGVLSEGGRRDPSQPALLLGTRKLELQVTHFAAGEAVEVVARPYRRSGDLVALDCAILPEGGGAPLVAARINVYALDAALPR